MLLQTTSLLSVLETPPKWLSVITTRTLLRFFNDVPRVVFKLAVEKLQLCLEEVPLIGNYATKSGLKIYPEKVRAVLEMPRPTDVKSLLRFNGTVQYLAKFLPDLSDMAHPLRQLTRKDAEWVWSETREKAWSDIKTAISQSPVLRFYSLQDEVTLQCDASDTGLGAALLQLQQPVRFASRALTQTETRYTQIDKELLAIVFACEKFDKYIFGRDVVHVETDHKPLEEIFKKEPLRCSSKASADAIATSTLQSPGQVQERSPHVHCGHAQLCISQGNVAFRGSEIS